MTGVLKELGIAVALGLVLAGFVPAAVVGSGCRLPETSSWLWGVSAGCIALVATLRWLTAGRQRR